ncbi:MAG: rRNA maturation RNase YbeY [Bacilli bacterium]|nr:rRNA maturation RNase YbeY [Bacilli bacterium]MBN2696929.1 rRNA maturation RNase YbeY [Bacilli bacterium]
MLKINLIDQYDQPIKGSKRVVFKALKQAYKTLNIPASLIVNVIFVNDESIQILNRDYRQIDKATDVLSFENDEGLSEIGDIFISLDKAKAQAQSYGHSYERELAFLAVHGFLHCLGYDHQDQKEEQEMFELQDKILKQTKYTR